MNGLHLTIDISNCTNKKALENVDDIRHISDIINLNGFTLIGEQHYQFETGGFTSVWLLAESHISLHTWPELNSCTVDIYACDVNSKHENEVRNIANHFIKLFDSNCYHIQDIWRGYNPTHSDFVCKDMGIYYRGNVQNTIQSKFQRIDIIQSSRFGKSIKLDGILMSTEKDEYMYHEPMVHIPSILKGNIRESLVIGGDDLGSVREFLKYSTLTKVYVAEIDLEVISSTIKYCPEFKCQHVINNKKVHIIINDGIKVVSQLIEQNKKMDVVVLDLTDPGVLTDHIYSSNGLITIKNAMHESSILSCHLGLGMEPNDRIADTLDHLKKSFKHIFIYQSIIPSYGGTWLMACASDTSFNVHNLRNFDYSILNNKMLDTNIKDNIIVHPLVVKTHPQIKEYICNYLM